MLKSERQALLLQLLAQNGKLTCIDACEKFGISRDTFYRDVNELAEREVLVKVHGGIFPVTEKRIQSSPEAVVAAKATTLIRPKTYVSAIGDGVIIQIAKSIPGHLNLHFLTTNIAAVLEFRSNQTIRVSLLGTEVLNHSSQTTGINVVDDLRKYHSNLCLIEI